MFHEVEVHLWFNRNKQISDHEVTGGRWLTEDEYAEELAIFNAPPEEESEEEMKLRMKAIRRGEADEPYQTKIVVTLEA